MSILSSLNQLCDISAPGPAAREAGRYSYPVSVDDNPCRFEKRDKEVHKSDGSTFMSSGLLFLAPDATIDQNYQVVTGGSTYIAEDVQTMRENAAISHYEVECRRA